jgi:hypothetical protein
MDASLFSEQVGPKCRMPNRPSAALAERLAAFLPERIELLGVERGVPSLDYRGPLVVPADLAAAVHVERERLSAPGRYNERQAVLAAPPQLDCTPPVLPYHDVEYAALAAMRAAGRAPFVLSSSVLLVSDETRQIFVQRRSAFCDAAAGLLHTVSGAQRFPIPSSVEPALLDTAWREVHEETGLEVGAQPGVPMLLALERLATSFQFVVLGTRISAAQAAAIHSSVEGDIVAIGFDDLQRSLLRPIEWAATGYFHVLAWLAFDQAPRTFDGAGAHTVLDRALAASRDLHWPGYLRPDVA